MFKVLRPPERTTRNFNPWEGLKVYLAARFTYFQAMKRPDEDEQGDEDRRDDGNHLIDHGGNSPSGREGEGASRTPRGYPSANEAAGMRAPTRARAQ